MKELDLDKDRSELRQIDKDGKEVVYKLVIDTFMIKIFAILMCQGSSSQKSSILFDLIIGPKSLKQGKD